MPRIAAIGRVDAAVHGPWPEVTPSPGPFGLARHDRSGAPIASDCGVTLFMQRVCDDAVFLDVVVQLIVVEIGKWVDPQRVHFDID